MKPEDVPVELAEIGREALYKHTAAYLPPVLMLPTYEDRARAVLAAVLPEHEKQLRAERDALRREFEEMTKLHDAKHRDWQRSEAELATARATIERLTTDWRRRAAQAARRVNAAADAVAEVRWNAWRAAYECLAAELSAALDASQRPEDTREETGS